MLIDYDILKHFGSTKARIKQVFTAQAGTDDYEIRKKWQDKIESRIHEGAQWGIKNHQFYYAADMAMDTNVVTKELVPLSLYAQNKITLVDAATKLKDISAETAAKFCTYDEKENLVSVDIPAFHKVVVALVRSFVTLRCGALSMRYVKNTPFLKYEPIGTGYVAQLKGDVLTQRVEMITNAYGYRHDLIQRIRAMLTHGFAVEFAACSWEQEKTLRKQKSSSMMADGELHIESVISKEGIPFKGVHPTRMFFDMAHPLSSINTDTGCSYIGHWDLVPYRDVCENPNYFNRDRIEYDTSFASVLMGYRGYFELYSATAPINFPSGGPNGSTAGYNDRDTQAGLYSTESDSKDTSILFTEYFEKIIPSECGLGDYAHPVWIRLVVAADSTVVYGEFMPFCPAVYYGYNANDGKILNMSFAHDAMAFQDQASNIMTAALLAQKSALIKLISLDIDQISDPEHVKLIRRIMAGEDLYTAPLLLEHKGVQSAEMGQDRRKIVEINETRAVSSLTEHLSNLMQLIGISERLLGVSANEQGRSEAREISATESANIASVTSISLAFMGQGVDEAQSAKKRIVYEGLMAKGESKMRIPVVERYTDATVRAAGFEPEDDGTVVLDGVARRVTVKGAKSAIEYDYSFTNRDGSERPSNAKSAEVMTLLFQQLAQVPGLLQAWGTEGLYDFLNAIVRLSGAPSDIKFKIPDGQTGAQVGTPAEAPAEAAPAQGVLQAGTIPAAAAQVSTDKTGGFLSGV